MEKGVKRLLFGVLAAVCLFWLANSWTEYRIGAVRPIEIALAGILTLVFGFFTFRPPARTKD
jgi:hypothetical protein